MFIIHIKFHNVYKVFGTLTLEAKETHPNSTRLRIYQSLSGVCELALLATMHLTLPIRYLLKLYILTSIDFDCFGSISFVSFHAPAYLISFEGG